MADRPKRPDATGRGSEMTTEVLEKTVAYKGYFEIHKYRLRHSAFAGGWSPTITREVFERGHAAAVMPYDPDRDRLLFIEQFRAGAYAAGLDPWLLEFVAGIVEAGEKPEEVVRREAVEEAGCVISDLLPIGRYLASQGGSSETVAIYCGRFDSAGAGGLFGLDHEGEDIRAFTTSFDEAMTLLESGRINNATTTIALQWLALNRECLRTNWHGSASA